MHSFMHTRSIIAFLRESQFVSFRTFRHPYSYVVADSPFHAIDERAFFHCFLMLMTHGLT
jgi:hypothetical protein